MRIFMMRAKPCAGGRLVVRENREREIGDKSDGYFRWWAIEDSRRSINKHLTLGDVHRREEVFYNKRTHRHSPYYTPDYCIAWFIDLCLLRTLSTIILCSLYLVFIFLREKDSWRAAHRVGAFENEGMLVRSSTTFSTIFSPPSSLSFPFFPEMRPTTAAATRRS